MVATARVRSVTDRCRLRGHVPEIEVPRLEHRDRHAQRRRRHRRHAPPGSGAPGRLFAPGDARPARPTRRPVPAVRCRPLRRQIDDPVEPRAHRANRATARLGAGTGPVQRPAVQRTEPRLRHPDLACLRSGLDAGPPDRRLHGQVERLVRPSIRTAGDGDGDSQPDQGHPAVQLRAPSRRRDGHRPAPVGRMVPAVEPDHRRLQPA